MIRTKQLLKLANRRNFIQISYFCSKSSNSSSDYDIIISGGGLVGTTLACSLAKSERLCDKSILLLEGAPVFKRTNIEGYSNRVSALSPGTIDLMKAINAWDHISATRFKAVGHMQIWDAASDAHISFRGDPNKPLAYIVENDLVLDAVYNQLKDVKNVKILNNSRVEKVNLVPKPSVSLKSGETYSADLLIGADGYNSLVRKAIGGSDISLSYEQMGVVATIELSEANDNITAWQRFIPTGPVALLPLNESLSSLVWTTTKDHAKKLLQMDATEFIDALNEAFYKEYKKDRLVTGAMDTFKSIFGNNMGEGPQFPPKIVGVVDKSRAAFPLGFSHNSTYVMQGAAIVGDAAHRIHPMAGQGVNLGFGDVKCLTEVLSEASYRGADLGDVTHLVQYEKERLLQNLPIMFGVHGLQRLYNTDNPLVVALRSIGLKLTHGTPQIKDLFMSRAMS
ncbi:ubiquinone biosynthesis monooxygenase COQ6, mitochondrial [Culicoides brevitarsis]|uniref:ubiquinone biosynthesis monooxygenase COQ6, mitochondrial n=1 Tax=Culicoides brevitarsis TaxID=469753 RepID=UPI00307B5295